MSYRYNTIDIAVGVGLCAILFGALLFFAAANGTYQAALPEAALVEQSASPKSGMTWLQPALGQAIVEQALFERHANRAIALAAAEWNRATLAHQEFLSRPGGPFGAIMDFAINAPAQHQARVQGVMGQAIVNFTLRGVRAGLVSADQLHSTFNREMIRRVETRGTLLTEQFTSTWQATLGRRIVEAAQAYRKQAEMIQERLGAALVQLALAQLESEHTRFLQQENMGSLVLAAARAQARADRSVSSMVTPAATMTAEAVPERPATWPDVPFAYLVAAACLLAAIFAVGLSWAARSREEKELAKMQRDASRWVYRMAS